MKEPNPTNLYLCDHVARLLHSFTRFTGTNLVPGDLPSVEQARRLFHAPFVVLSHNIAPDPVLNYGNRAALKLFELSWDDLVRLPSRMTAEPVERAERERLLAAVTARGYIDNYRGVRISRSGRRFMIEEAVVWNLLDEDGVYYGQAATFERWHYLE